MASYVAVEPTIDKDGGDTLSSTSLDEISVGGQHFCVVGAALMLVKSLKMYCEIARSFRGCISQVCENVLALLREFNERSTSLLLYAGARKVAGLEKITARHLALLVQCLGLGKALIPGLVQCFLSVCAVVTPPPSSRRRRIQLVNIACPFHFPVYCMY